MTAHDLSSSTPPAKPGTGSQPNQRSSPRSVCAIGPTSITNEGLWYKTAILNHTVAIREFGLIACTIFFPPEKSLCFK
jgi:hypothetical protein